MRNKLLLATKVAHEELGDKVAVFLGCTVALRVGGLRSDSAAKALALVLLEAVSDVAKAVAYAASKIDVGHVRFNFNWSTLLGVVLVGGESLGGLFGVIRVNCLSAVVASVRNDMSELTIIYYIASLEALLNQHSARRRPLASEMEVPVVLYVANIIDYFRVLFLYWAWQEFHAGQPWHFVGWYVRASGVGATHAFPQTD
jgi:hypothetical protein